MAEKHLTPEQCDSINLLLDDALLGKAVREMLAKGGVSEIMHDALSRHRDDRYAFTQYVDFRLKEVLPLKRISHAHG